MLFWGLSDFLFSFSARADNDAFYGWVKIGSFGDLVLTSLLIEGTYPDYERVIPLDNDKVLEVEAAAYLCDSVADHEFVV